MRTKLSESKILERLKAFPQWTTNAGGALERTYTFKDFRPLAE